MAAAATTPPALGTATVTASARAALATAWRRQGRGATRRGISLSIPARRHRWRHRGGTWHPLAAATAAPTTAAAVPSMVVGGLRWWGGSGVGSLPDRGRTPRGGAVRIDRAAVVAPHRGQWGEGRGGHRWRVYSTVGQPAAGGGGSAAPCQRFRASGPDRQAARAPRQRADGASTRRCEGCTTRAGGVHCSVQYDGPALCPLGAVDQNAGVAPVAVAVPGQHSPAAAPRG